MPSPVDKYFKQVKKDNPSYSDEQAWATAWSIYCKHKNPGSDHCHKDPSEYLKGKSAADLRVISAVASRVIEAASPAAVVLTEDDYKAMSAQEKVRWKGYSYRMAYESWDSEALEAGETDNKGWKEEGSMPYDSLEELCRSVSRDAKWLGWSDDRPTKRSWIMSQPEEDRTGANVEYHLWIEREDGQPLGVGEIKFINRELRI